MSNRTPMPRIWYHQIGAAVFLLAVLAACTVKFASSYDEQTDRAVTELQKKFESFFVTLENQDGLPECTYAHHKSFYEQAQVEISSIELRASAIPQNSITREQVGLLSQSLDSLEELHRLKAQQEAGHQCITGAEIEPLRANFNTIFTAILTFELAKKRGEEP